VLFTDFVRFTQVSERLSPKELVNELHVCLKAFDGIISKHNIEKIKTIGDAYLAVCGLPKADPKHAENIVNAAKEIRAFMKERHAQFGDKTFQIRLGIHSGSVVAGIVGIKKFAYDIWGDTVNTAARMEQNSEAGKINISHTTYELVKDKFTCEYRGEIEAKNKGALKMYFVA
jgi:class 3 adenylate cyclase